tara:strand:+ start:65 stop:805 length:741 start_codon:yes stop_codon:yes gene_type:complete
MSKLIAEIGLNHLGDPKRLMVMIEKIIASKVYALTIQIQNDEYYNLSKPFRKKIDLDLYKKISKRLKSKKIKFGIALVDKKTLQDFSSVNVDFWKILSMQFFNKELIKKALATKKKVYLSTGVVSMQDIKAMAKRFKSLNFIHTSFSLSLNKANLLAIKKMKNEVKNQISFGLHSNLDSLIISAIALESESIFFYVKNKDKKHYPDDEHAIYLEELKVKVKNWKKMILSLGNGIKKRESLPKWVFE